MFLKGYLCPQKYAREYFCDHSDAVIYVMSNYQVFGLQFPY
jgi:hypothetical protein